MKDIEDQGYEFGVRGLSAVVHAPYRNDIFHNAWMRGWHRGYDEHLRPFICLSCGIRAAYGEAPPCGH